MREGKAATAYVPAIDGMRAVAVLGVLVYHLKLRGLSGGFVGVDIFFVISGYLISKIIFTEVDAGNFSFAGFYERRIRRIVPAMFVVLAITSLAFLVIFSPPEFGAFEKSLQAAVFSVSNFYFYSTVDYFNNSSDIPLLHTWSLGVEEQFYFLFPALVMVSARLFPRRRIEFLLLFGGLSLASSLYLTYSNQPAAFYFPTSRWWELMAGSILAAINFAGPEWARRKVALSWAGAIGTVLSLVFLNDKMAFPGYVVLLPVLGACALIVGASSVSIPNAILTALPSRWFGKISYSLYLIHWPVISFLWCFTAVGNRKAALLAVVISVGLAWLSWKFVETPFRRKSQRTEYKKLFSVFFFSCLALFLIGKAEGAAVKSFWDQYPEAEQFQARLGGLHKVKASMNAESCFLTKAVDNIALFDEADCLKLSDSRKNVLLMGDSHSADLIRALRIVFPQINFLQASASGCAPVLDASGAERCRDLMNHVFEQWLPAHQPQISAVILSAKWQSEDISGVEKTVAWLSSNSIRSVVMGPSPEFTVPLPRLLAYSVVLKSPPLVQRFIVKERKTLDQKFKSDAGISTHYISVSEVLCGNLPSGGNCEVTVNGAPLYFDRDHFTDEGSVYTINLLSKDLSSRF